MGDRRDPVAVSPSGAPVRGFTPGCSHSTQTAASGTLMAIMAPCLTAPALRGAHSTPRSGCACALLPFIHHFQGQDHLFRAKNGLSHTDSPAQPPPTYTPPPASAGGGASGGPAPRGGRGVAMALRHRPGGRSPLSGGRRRRRRHGEDRLQLPLRAEGRRQEGGGRGAGGRQGAGSGAGLGWGLRGLRGQ